ncbi:MAG: hypothetical protein RMY28_006165 [Nostoc sp. ChiSLP01]
MYRREKSRLWTDAMNRVYTMAKILENAPISLGLLTSIVQH